jgi:fatty acyl-CoA reductase
MQNIYEFYKQQTVFLTGATGGLGGCLLYKLAVVLKVPKLFVLVRQSEEKAIERWKKTMPDQTQNIVELIQKRTIILVQGNMTKEMFGIHNEVLEILMRETTIVIHAAANISFAAPLKVVVRDNCIPVLNLAAIVTKMTRLRSFVHVSTCYANSFLPDGPVEERLYLVSDDPEAELTEILQTGATKHLGEFPWAYAYSKNLAERLLHFRFPLLPLLIIRPSSIGPALAQPFTLYGPEGSCPISTLFSRMMRPSKTKAAAMWYSPTSGQNILDEIPVDIVANVILRHIDADTRGVVHASSAYYVPKSIEWMFSQVERCLPPRWVEKISRPVFTTDASRALCKEATFYKMGGRDWRFQAPSQNLLPGIGGDLDIDIAQHDIDQFIGMRLKAIFVELFGSDRWIKETEICTSRVANM